MGTVALRDAVARPSVSDGSRILLIDGIRAGAAIAIVWHHFAQYWPVSETAQPILYRALTQVHDYARVAQVFFVISGFVMAKTMSIRHWTRGEFGRFLAHRYCRLGLPYLAVIVLAMVACAIGRGWLPDELIGPPPKLSQLLAHTIFLQDILGYGSMSAGLWFVCINFQLGLLYALMLWMRDTLAQSKTAGNWKKLPLAAGFLLSLCSLFYFNLHDSWSVWCVYYFGEFFLGVLAEAALRDPAMRKWFAGYVMIVAAALAEHWRWRLATSTCAGLLLYFSELRGARQMWSANGVVSYLGRTSYSLFLVHYPVLLVVAAVWMRMGWNSTSQIIGGLAIAFVASLASASIFYRFVEEAAGRLSRTTKRAALHEGAERGEADAQISAAIAQAFTARSSLGTDGAAVRDNLEIGMAAPV
jgi:peptidoglycan/LPS O-acetylase OafA/YrhL